MVPIRGIGRGIGRVADEKMGGQSSHLVGKSLKEIERWAIENTLTLANGNREDTSNILGISERNLYRKLKEYQLS